MSKFHSDWIGRNVFYRETVGEGGVPHFKQYERPVIVALCGSTRFKAAWYEQTKRLTYEGRIVLGVGDLNPNAPDTNVPLDAELKERLDVLHKQKIDLADEVLVLDVRFPWCPACGKWCASIDHRQCRQCSGGVEMQPYIGTSTRSEIEHAKRGGKTIRYLSQEASA